jgi:membrane protease YdiL (CAAX protease family)
MSNGKIGFIVLGKLLLSAVFIFTIVLLLSFPVTMIGVSTLENPTDLDAINDLVTNDETMQYAMMFVTMFAFIGAALIMYALFERKKKWSLGWKQAIYIVEAIKGMLAGIILMTISFLLIWLLGGFKITGVVIDSSVVKSLLFSFILFTAVAINEELFSRGYVQGLIKYHFNTKAAVIVSSLLFALFHSFNPGVFNNPLPLLNLILAGILLGVSREVSGGLWMPIGIHLTWNFFQGNVYGFAVSGLEVESVVRLEQTGNAIISGGSFGAEGSVLTSIILIVGTYGVYKYYTNAKAKKSSQVYTSFEESVALDK